MASLTQSDYKSDLQIYQASVPPTADTPAAKLISLLDSSNDLLFQGKEEIQPIKIYQVGRIYKLAKSCIEIITLIWPYLKFILPLLKKIF